MNTSSSRRHLIRAALALLIGGAALTTAADVRATDGSFPQKVKEVGGYMLFAEDGFSWVHSASCVPNGFTAQSPAPVIASGAGDPNVRTSSPVSLAAACPIFDGDGDGQWDFNFDVNYRSLRDLGVNTVTCTGSNVDPSFCWSAVSPPCNIVCDLNHVFPFAGPVNFFLTVFNQPPTASPDHTPAPAWNNTVTLHANGSDPDGGSLTFNWRITSKPPMATATLSATNVANPTIAFSGDKNIGTWQFAVDVADNEAEQRTFTHSFTVPNVPPAISITGASMVDALQPIALGVTPTTDVDGGNLTFKWDILQVPVHSDTPVGNNVSTAATLNLPTDGTDVGIWRFRVTATDNEGATDAKEKTVTVRNLPPRIEFSGAHEIDVGQNIQAQTTVLTDDDGGNLTFEWKVVQAPQSAGVAVPSVVSTSASITRPTAASAAGTWIFRLTATDDEAESVHQDFLVLVDALPIADLTGPDQLNMSSFPLVLDGSASTDPDSPCPGTANHCHVADGMAVSVSPGIVSYTWYVVDIPPDQWGPYTTGRADDVLGVPGGGPQLTIPLGHIAAGQWKFELEVTDGEGNVDHAQHSVLVVPPQTRPIAVVSGPQWVLANLAGQIPNAIVIDGRQSFDLDNILSGPPAAGMGIINYQWTAVTPAGCLLPALPSGPAASVLTLFPAGGTVPPLCQGFWQLRLTVTDDDMPAQTGFADTTVVIGNCATGVCIDAPTGLFPAIVESWDVADVDIYYHIDSTLYFDPIFAFGMFTKLEILPNGGSTPVYTTIEPFVPPWSRGLPLVFNWNGYTSAGDRPATGWYDVRVTLLDSSLIPTFSFALEAGAIQTENVTVDLASAEPYLDHDRTVSGGGVSFDYSVAGSSLGIDSLVWRVRNTAGNVVTQSNVNTSLLNGTFDWDGLVGVTMQPSGSYTMEAEVFRGGRSLGISLTVPFQIYRLDVGVTGHVIPPSGLPVAVNVDDDDANGLFDFLQAPAPAAENDLVAIDLTFAPVLTGDLVLSASAPGVRVWTTANKTGELTLPKTFHSPADVVPARVYVEAFAAGAPDLRLEFQPPGGAPLPQKAARLNLWVLETMADTSNDFQVGPGDSSTLFVRPGLFDFAFRLAADGFGAINTLYDESDQVRRAAAGNPDNFIGRDSRRFYYRLTDAARNQNPAVAEEYPLDWFTLKADGVTNDDRPPTDRAVTLTETGPNTGVFVSEALLLVSDLVDRNQPNNTGLTAHPGNAAYDARDHRIRHVTSPDGRVVARYQPIDPLAAAVQVPTSVYQRFPEERRVVTVRAFNFADPMNLGTAAIPAATVNGLLQVVQERYLIAGVRVEVVYNHATDVLTLPAGSPVNLNNVGSFTGSHGNLAPSADQTALINLVRGVEPATPANANTLYVLFINNFSSGDRGQSFPDGWIPAGSAAQNFVMVAGLIATIYTATHEVGHQLTNAVLTAGEASGTTAGWAAGGHYGGVHDIFNVMRPVTVAGPAVNDSKRLWDDTAVHTIQQLTRVRATRFMRLP